MLLHIHHETKLTYSEPVAENVFELRMAPVSTDDQTVLGYRLRIMPPAPVTTYHDGFGNRVDLFNLLAPCREVVVQATSVVRTHRRAGEPRLAAVAWPGEQPIALEAFEFLSPSPLVDPSAQLDAFLASGPEPAGSLAEVVRQVLEAVRARLKYEKKVTTVRTPVSEALALGRGVCQDFAHLFLGACRRLGLSARYVSGYVNQPGEIATHAWCQVWGGSSVGWVDVDPTRGEFAGDDHVVTAVARDYADVPPNRGAWKGHARETISVAVQVQPVERMPANWSDWLGTPTSWSASAFSWSQRRQRPNSFHQAGGRNCLRQQQSQQQQSPSP
jgi:transglutaminase-like putative cysteine protease